jgi:ATP-binding cassette, subfamily B, multidrug efflux pump
MSRESERRTTRRPHGGPMGHMGMIPAQKAKNFRNSLIRLIGYLKPYRLALLVVFVTAILSTLFSILSPKILGHATDVLFDGMIGMMKGIPGAGINFSALLQILTVLGGLYLLSSAFSYVQQYIMAGVAQKMVYHLREEINQKLERLPLKYFDSNSHGDILSRAVNDTENISNTLQQSLTMMITSVVTFIGVIVMMLTISPLMTLILVLTLPLSFMVIKSIAGRSQKLFMEQQKQLGALNGHVEEMISGHNIVKAFGLEKKSINKFGEINEKLYVAGWRAQFISGIIMPLMMFVGNIGYILICVVGGILVTHKTIRIGDIQAFIQYARQFSQPINQIAQIANIIQSTVASAERVFEILDEEEGAPVKDEPIFLSLPKGEVIFDHVSFRYKKDEPLLEDINIKVKPGQSVAIVGPTGAGKTTLVNLLMRFYDINEGKITIDGVNIEDMDRGHLHQLFGMVLQDSWLFKGTIRDNIAYGKENATEEEIVTAAKAAHADHFIRTLPDGYDLVLNEETSNISQGQKQLLTIARAVLADPAILILDEATSNVDTRTEMLIQKAMDHLMEDRTSFVIAHRLSTIQGADLILVLDRGHLIEQGTHEELLEKKGFYAELYNSQFSTFAKGVV